MKRKTEQLLDKAQDAIEAAALLLQGEKHSFAAGRADYAMFYLALLLQHEGRVDKANTFSYRESVQPRREIALTRKRGHGL